MTGRILIVDGLPTNRIILRVKLAAAYYEVMLAETGAAALDMIGQHQPDAVIVSMDLPDFSGPELCARIKANQSWSEIPVVLVHGIDQTDARISALSAGADDILTRPIDELVLLARLRSLLRARDAEAELRLRDDTQRALGLAEEAAGFAVPARVAIVPIGAPRKLEPLLEDLRKTLPDRISIVPQDSVLRDLNPPPEVVVILEHPASEGGGLGLLANLRASTETRHAAILYVTYPKQRRSAASALDLGANDLMCTGPEPREMVLRLQKQIRRKRHVDRLRDNVRDGLRAALTDPLTELFNRRYAMPHLARMAERAAQQKRPLAVMVADLDHFKRVNDVHGHAAGDAVLTGVARRLSNNLRAADLLARLGGEEFLIAMPDTDCVTALHLASRLCQLISSHPFEISPSGLQLPQTLSIGIAIATPENNIPSSELIAMADRALYCAKADGRNQALLGPVAA
ncbi:diguanylate cyclase [Puniceibacterium sediminis]|uniref:diguanylate cyclase n=1 Tax=Puniceibacterium sediminis TaxID=1608407 RepID=A0A238Y0I4_9RHOB|nr:diguanylate cyclase [Puniceibacterium sediminis]SNR64657.1 response regulator receiver modulated diguanylate cyclase [Puniceibacterium sediminis]